MSFDVFLQGFRAGESAPLAGLRLPDEWVVLETEDGGVAEVDGDGESCAFVVRSLTPQLVAAIWNTATASGGVLLPAIEDMRAVLSDETQRADLPEELQGDAVVCGSAEELAALLEGGYEQWTLYRDHAAGT